MSRTDELQALSVDDDARQDQMKVIMIFLECLIGETMSPDSIHLAAASAMSKATQSGINADTAEDCLLRLIAFSKEKQERQPLHAMF